MNEGAAAGAGAPAAAAKVVGANDPPKPPKAGAGAGAGDLVCAAPKELVNDERPPAAGAVKPKEPAGAAGAPNVFVAGVVAVDPNPKLLVVVALGDLLKEKALPAAGAGVVAAAPNPNELAPAAGAPNGCDALCCAGCAPKLGNPVLVPNAAGAAAAGWPKTPALNVEAAGAPRPKAGAAAGANAPPALAPKPLPPSARLPNGCCAAG